MSQITDAGPSEYRRPGVDFTKKGKLIVTAVTPSRYDRTSECDDRTSEYASEGSPELLEGLRLVDDQDDEETFPGALTPARGERHINRPTVSASFGAPEPSSGHSRINRDWRQEGSDSSPRQSAPEPSSTPEPSWQPMVLLPRSQRKDRQAARSSAKEKSCPWCTTYTGLEEIEVYATVQLSKFKNNAVDLEQLPESLSRVESAMSKLKKIGETGQEMSKWCGKEARAFGARSQTRKGKRPYKATDREDDRQMWQDLVSELKTKLKDLDKWSYGRHAHELGTTHSSVNKELVNLFYGSPV